MTSLAISLGALPIAMSLGAASTSRIGMGVVIVENYIFISTNSFVIPALYFMWSRTKTLSNLNTLKNMKKMLIKMKIIKRTTQILFFIFHCWFSNSGKSLDN
jgi:hypothetical protein